MKNVIVRGPLPRYIDVPGTWLDTTGAPLAATGSNGDYALDRATMNLYFKHNGAWLDLGVLGAGGGGGGMSCAVDSTSDLRDALSDVSYVAGPGLSALSAEFVQLGYLESGDIIRFIGNVTASGAGLFWFIIDWSALYTAGRGYDGIPCNAQVLTEDALTMVNAYPKYFGQSAKVYFQAPAAGTYFFEVQGLFAKSNKCDD